MEEENWEENFKEHRDTRPRGEFESDFFFQAFAVQSNLPYKHLHKYTDTTLLLTEFSLSPGYQIHVQSLPL